MFLALGAFEKGYKKVTMFCGLEWAVLMGPGLLRSEASFAMNAFLGLFIRNTLRMM